MSKPSSYMNYLQATNNFLLIKDEVGKPKPPTRELPNPAHVYGKKTENDKEGAGSLLTYWQTHRGSQGPKPDKDFKKLNAISVTEKVVTSSEQYQFRKNMDIRMQSAHPRARQQMPDITFGNEYRPSTPMKALISNFYGEYAGDKLNLSYTPKEQKGNIPQGRSTKGFDLRNEAIKSNLKQPSKTLFKLKKFEKILNKTETRRK